MNRFFQLIAIALLLLSYSVEVAAQALPFHLAEGAGTFRLGLVCGEESRWLDECKIKQKGQQYTITDNLWKGGTVQLTVHPLSDTKGFIMEVTGNSLPTGAQLCWAYGACDETMQAPPTNNQILPKACADNVFSVEGNAFTVYYGKVMALRTVIGVTPEASTIRLSNAHQQASPLQLWNSGKKTDSPVISALCPWNTADKLYFCFYHQNEKADYNYFMLPELFQKEAR